MTDHIGGPATGRDTLRAVARWAGAPFWNRLRPRIETIAAERSSVVERDLRIQLADLHAQVAVGVADLRAALDATNVDLGGQVVWTQQQIGSQVAALDERVALLERAPAGPPGDGDDQAAARSLVDEVRAEHARVRARLTAVASYEHRIATLEQALASLAGNGGETN